MLDRKLLIHSVRCTTLTCEEWKSWDNLPSTDLLYLIMRKKRHIPTKRFIKDFSNHIA